MANWHRYTKEFKATAVERLKDCTNILALAQELNVPRRLLYEWRDQQKWSSAPETQQTYRPKLGRDRRFEERGG